MKAHISITVAVCLVLIGLVSAQDAAQPVAVPSPDGAAPPAGPAENPLPELKADAPPADEAGSAVVDGLGPAIPQAYPADRYTSTWGKNPFLVEVAPTTAPQVSFAQDWALTGLTVRPSGEATAYIRNKQTQEFKRVGPTADADGFKLVKANPNPNRKDASVEVTKGTETATLKYDEVAAAPPPTGAARVPVPGQPNGAAAGTGQIQQRPGMPQPVQNNMGRRPVVPGQTGVPGQVPQPGMAQPGMVPNAVPASIPRNPSNRRRILIPPPVAQDPNAAATPTPQ